jgi:uncharacterized YccA/Bax inhibitor family protein
MYILKGGLFMDLNFSIATIATFVGILDQITKTMFKTYGKKEWDKFIPIFSIAYGLILGISGYFIPNVDMGNNIIEAIFVGLSAGAASTGIHQIYHQQIKDDTTEPSTTETTTVEEEIIVNDTEEENKE